MGPEAGEGGWAPGVAAVGAEETAQGAMKQAALPCRSKADLHPTPTPWGFMRSDADLVQACPQQAGQQLASIVDRCTGLPSQLLGMRRGTEVQ